MSTDLKAFEGKKVVLVRNLDKPNAEGNTAEELEGTLVAVAAEAVMFKPKGKTSAQLIEVKDLESVNHADAGVRKLTRKTLKIVEFGQARNHLLERHGLTLTVVNEMTEQAAYDSHAGIDHVASDLGHVHGVKTKAEDKAESAESSEDEDED
jgi:hypothetical protein